MTPSTVTDKTSGEMWLEHSEKLHFDAFFWKEKAACKGAGPDATKRAFSPLTNVQAGFAEDFCMRCTVREQCLYYAIVIQNEYGVWGGCTETQISHIIKDIRSEFRSLRYNWSTDVQKKIVEKIKEIESHR